jgi:hypothetical protein
MERNNWHVRISELILALNHASVKHLDNSLAKSVAITFPIDTESTKLEAQMKFMLLNLVTSFLGRPARKKE